MDMKSGSLTIALGATEDKLSLRHIWSDFYDILMAQPEDEAKDIAVSLELFVNGSLNIFNHQTNVDVDNRFTVYGIRDLLHEGLWYLL